MTDRPKVRFLIPLWGKRYIEEFAEVCLPSHLAPGNLPYLAEQTDLAVRVMTTAESQPYFDRSPTFNRLRELCPVEFIEIDDLVTKGMYGVTLTLAYARAMQASGAEQTDTWFVLMNSDFALADGAMRTVVDKIRTGRRCLLAPSLRACAEPVFAALRERVDPTTHVLSVGPRGMVGFAFRYIHPTAFAKTITQSLFACTTYNQLYWQVDGNTLLGRYHLIFPLLIRPERPLGDVNSYVDYGFVPQLVPSDDFEVLGDSDDFFMLELQPTEQEKEFLYGGEPTTKGIARELARWTTREHRLFARQDAVFHTAVLPQALNGYRAVADRFVHDLHQAMPAPIDHVDHYYWYFGVQSWMMQSHSRHTEPDIPLPAELGDFTVRTYLSRRIGRKNAPAGARLHDWISPKLAGIRALLGSMPNVSILHRDWLDAQILKQRIAAIRDDTPSSPLLITGAWTGTRELWEAQVGGDVAFVDLIHDEGLSGRSYDRILVTVEGPQLQSLADVLSEACRCLAPEGRIEVVVGAGVAGARSHKITSEMARHIERVLPCDWFSYKTSVVFVGGIGKNNSKNGSPVSCAGSRPPVPAICLFLLQRWSLGR